jgi:O-antigen ligase
MPIVAAPPWPVVALIVSYLLPIELSVRIFGLLLAPSRAVLLIVTPIAVWHLVAGRGPRLRLFDWLIIAFGAASMFSYGWHHGFEKGLSYGGAVTLESVGSYLLARVWIRDGATLRAVLALLVGTIALAAALALPEALLGRPFLHEAMHALTGVGHYAEPETRLGLTRAYATFDHPIHYGTYCASLLGLVWFCTPSPWSRAGKALLIAFATLLALSSAPLLGVVLQLGLIVWERSTRWLKSRVPLMLACIAGLYIGAGFVSNRGPIGLIATSLTINPQTGYYRMLIWEHGFANVRANPWLGIGLNDWARPAWMAAETIDTYWLVLAMRHGLPTAALLVIAIYVLIRAVWRCLARFPDAERRRIATGWTISLVAFILVACTVHLWNVPHSFFFFILGLAGWLTVPRRSLPSEPAATSRTGRRSPRRSASERERRPLPATEPRGAGALPAIGGTIAIVSGFAWVVLAACAVEASI